MKNKTNFLNAKMLLSTVLVAFILFATSCKHEYPIDPIDPIGGGGGYEEPIDDPKEPIDPIEEEPIDPIEEEPVDENPFNYGCQQTGTLIYVETCDKTSKLGKFLIQDNNTGNLLSVCESDVDLPKVEELADHTTILYEYETLNTNCGCDADELFKLFHLPTISVKLTCVSYVSPFSQQ